MPKKRRSDPPCCWGKKKKKTSEYYCNLLSSLSLLLNSIETKDDLLAIQTTLKAAIESAVEGKRTRSILLELRKLPATPNYSFNSGFATRHLQAVVKSKQDVASLQEFVEEIGRMVVVG